MTEMGQTINDNIEGTGAEIGIVDTYSFYELGGIRILSNRVGAFADRPGFLLKDGSKPKGEEVFVFGSNLAGIHGAGAALEAYKNYGARLYYGIGWYGNSFAIPTKDINIRTLPLSEIKKYVDFLLKSHTNIQVINFL